MKVYLNLLIFMNLLTNAEIYEINTKTVVWFLEKKNNSSITESRKSKPVTLNTSDKCIARSDDVGVLHEFYMPCLSVKL